MGRSNDCLINSIDYSSPRRFVSRWISGLRRCRVKREKDEKEFNDRTMQASCSMNALNELETGHNNNNNSKNDNSFNLGVGCCLLYLVAASKNELHKMMELRMQMEALLQNTRKDQLLKNDDLRELAEPNDGFRYSAAAHLPYDDPGFQTPTLPESSRVTVCDHSLKWETPEKGGMDQLGAELEAELDRLQFHLDREKLLRHPQQLNMKKWKVTDEHTTSSKSQTVSSGEVIDPQPQEVDTDCGVSPNELERRLHELLEARQQEQIAELETALQSLRHKLHEKKRELSWWKDTARLISQHAIEPPQFTSEHDPKIITQGEH